MPKFNSVPVETLELLLRYDSNAGELYWKHRPEEFFSSYCSYRSWNAKRAGKKALNSESRTGYYNGAIFWKSYLKHRVIWAMHYGEWPDGIIDHINGNTLDNRIANLRIVNDLENMHNQKLRTTNKSGVIGVYQKPMGSWIARITVNRKTTFIGQYRKLEDAIAARKKAEKEHGFHPNHGRKAA